MDPLSTAGMPHAYCISTHISLIHPIKAHETQIKMLLRAREWVFAKCSWALWTQVLGWVLTVTVPLWLQSHPGPALFLCHLTHDSQSPTETFIVYIMLLNRSFRCLWSWFWNIKLYRALRAMFSVTRQVNCCSSSLILRFKLVSRLALIGSVSTALPDLTSLGYGLEILLWEPLFSCALHI